MPHIGFNFVGRVRAAILGGGVAVLLATASFAGSALAADQPASTTQAQDAIGPHTHQIHGTIKQGSITATGFTVATERYGDVNVTFSGATLHGRGHGRARSFEVANANDLKDGDRVVVQGRASADGKTFIARRVHKLPARDAAAHPTHVVGTIIASTSGSNGSTTLTISPSNGGAARSVTVTSETKIRPDGETVADLKVGSKVTVVSKNGTVTGVAVIAS